MGYRIEYDEIYNRTSMSREGMDVKLPAAFTNDPAYNAANRLTAFNSNSVSHDENGNMTGWGSTTYTWDEFNQLVAINGTSLDASYKYDALGRRIEKTINNTTTRYLYDGADIVLEMNENNATTIYYIRTLNIDEPLARIELDSGGNVTGIRFYLADALGSTIALTDENGDIKTRYNYTPFGEPEVSGDTSANPFMFTGREYDRLGDSPEANEGTGLYYYRARYYSWELGRFVSEDPIGLAGGINMYAYVGNSPLNFVDPLGLYSNDNCFGVECLAKHGPTHSEVMRERELNKETAIVLAGMAAAPIVILGAAEVGTVLLMNPELIIAGYEAEEVARGFIVPGPPNNFREFSGAMIKQVVDIIDDVANSISIDDQGVPKLDNNNTCTKGK